MKVFQNIIDNVTFLSNDFVEFSINIFGIGNFILHVFITTVVFFVFYLIGKKLLQLFFKEKTKLTFFVAMALEKIFIGTGIAVLGIFSLFRSEIIIGYLGLLFGIAIREVPWGLREGIRWMRKFKWESLLRKENVIIWGVALFVLLAFLRLMTPEIAEDGYHTDNARLFISSQTTMIAIKDPLHTIPFPQLPEMIYTLPIFLNNKEAARYIHFGFYVLIIVLLFAIAKDKKYSFAKFLPFLFATAPVVIRYSSSQYTDFFALFVFLLSAFLIERKMMGKQILLVGILFGAVVSAKVWMLVYLPAVVLYLLLLNGSLAIRKISKILALFFIGYLSVVGLWYIRAYVLTGNPFFPIANAVFIKQLPSEINPIPYLSSGKYIGFNWEMFTFQNLSLLSPFFFIGVVSLLFIFREKPFKAKQPAFILFVIIMLEQLVIQVSWGRYLLIWFILSSVFISSAILYFYKKSLVYKYGFISLFVLLWGYYFINTLFVLPYGWGWANKNAYLTRVLGRDNVSYYDFNGDFDKWITKKDLVVTYGIGSFYYADFNYLDIGDIYQKKSESFNLMRKRGVTKLMLKGGDIDWFCKELALKDCDKSKIRLLATYPQDMQKYNLYSIVLPPQK